MVSRLFGRSKKTSTPQEAQPPVSTPVEPEDDGFTLLGPTPQAQQGPQGMYPSIPAYPPGQGPSQVQASNGYSGATTAQYLDGVPFVLSSHCSMSGEQFDAVLAKIDSLSERVRNVNWSGIEYDFNVERSVVQDVGITDTLRRLHAS